MVWTKEPASRHPVMIVSRLHKQRHNLRWTHQHGQWHCAGICELTQKVTLTQHDGLLLPNLATLRHPPLPDKLNGIKAVTFERNHLGASLILLFSQMGHGSVKGEDDSSMPYSWCHHFNECEFQSAFEESCLSEKNIWGIFERAKRVSIRPRHPEENEFSNHNWDWA